MEPTESVKTGAIDTNNADGCYTSQPDGDIDLEEMALNDAEGSHDTSSLTSTLCSDLTAVDQKSTLFSDAGSDFLRINSATPSRICSMPVKLGEEYLFIARRLLMAKITDRYGVLFPFWVCECTTVPRDSSDEKSKPHPSQYYPLLQQYQEWKEWQEMNPNEIDPGREISLNAIEWHSEDPDDKPPFHLWYLILAAIHGSPIKRMTENEIKLCLIRRFCYFASRQGTRDGSAWITDVSNELEQNRLFNSLSMCKEDRDDPNCYWTIAHLPLEGTIFHPRNQTLDSAGCYSSNRTLSASLLTQSLPLQLHLQGRPVSEFQHVYTIKGAAAHDSSNWRDVSGDGGPKIPISMLMHPVNIDPLNQRIIEITVHNVESWHWIPS